MNESQGALEKPEDAGKGVSGEVKRWLLEISLSDTTEKRWRDDSNEVLKVYRADRFSGDKRKDTFNILWSNVEIKRPSLYNSTPRPDIRRRYKDKDPLGKAVSELVERCATYTNDCQDIDAVMIAAVNDMLLPGRAVTRVKYMPTLSEKTDGTEAEPGTEVTVDYEEVVFEQVQWDAFRRGPGQTWDEVTWIAFKHELTKSEIEEKFPDFADNVSYDISIDDREKKDLTEDDQTVFKRCLVWEVWDKDKREVLFLAPSYKENFIGRESDPLNLKQFWPIPRPLYAIECSTSLIPMPEYMMYETLAKELEEVTNRIRRILNGLRLRGVYDSTLSEIEKLFETNDNGFVAAEGVSALLERGGLDKAIWMLPVDTYAQVLIQLYEYRNNLIQQIYEITGISDIVRGATNPNETLGAQEIKANFGTQRLQRQQREVQRYARDLIRIAVEIISEKFDRTTLSLMSGMNFPTMADKQMAQMTLSQAQSMPQMPGQQPNPQVQQQVQQAEQVLKQPSWEEVEQVLRSDILREYRIDIETDSTIQAELQADQRNIVELITGITKYFEGIAPIVQSGVLPMEAAKQILMTAVRRFKLGRQVEDALEEMQQPPPQPNPEAEKMQMQMQADQQKMQAEMQMKREEMQMDMQRTQAEESREQRKSDLEFAHAQRMAQLEEQKMMLEMNRANQQHRLDIEKMAMQADYNKQKTDPDLKKPSQKENAA